MATTPLLALSHLRKTVGLDEQAMILRAIEDKRFLPVGSDKEVASNFQLIAGTDRDLGRAVTNGCFRDDLFARLNLWTFALPDLADRRDRARCAVVWQFPRSGGEHHAHGHAKPDRTDRCGMRRGGDHPAEAIVVELGRRGR
jgi:sigma54-dependent transcription regulator